MLTLNNNPIKAELSYHGSVGGVVQARYENCEEALCFVTFAQVGPDCVITSFGVNPHASAKEAQRAGDKIDNVLEREALKLGIKRLLIIHPGSSTAEFVRDYRPQPWTLREVNHPITSTPFVN